MPLPKQTHLETQGIRALDTDKGGAGEGSEGMRRYIFFRGYKGNFFKSSEVAVRLLHCPAPSRINIELQK